MKNFTKGKLGTVIILVFTVILAGVAIFTALRLYQLRSQPVAPNVPSSIPRAQEVTPTETPGVCTLSFTISSAPPSATPITTPTATPTGTPGPTEAPNSCGGTCGSDSNCQSDKTCYQGFCRNPSCVTSQNCVCAPTPPPASTPTPTAPALPKSGTDWPTVVGAGIGVFVIIGSLLLAL